MVAAVECTGSEMNADRGRHAERLEKIYSMVLNSSAGGKYAVYSKSIGIKGLECPTRAPVPGTAVATEFRAI